MQQRVAIAGAVAYEPHVMDEPFAEIDTQTRVDLEDLVRRLWRRMGGRDYGSWDIASPAAVYTIATLSSSASASSAAVEFADGFDRFPSVPGNLARRGALGRPLTSHAELMHRALLLLHSVQQLLYRVQS